MFAALPFVFVLLSFMVSFCFSFSFSFWNRNLRIYGIYASFEMATLNHRSLWEDIVCIVSFLALTYIIFLAESICKPPQGNLFASSTFLWRRTMYIFLLTSSEVRAGKPFPTLPSATTTFVLFKQMYHQSPCSSDKANEKRMIEKKKKKVFITQIRSNFFCLFLLFLRN